MYIIIKVYFFSRPRKSDRNLNKCRWSGCANYSTLSFSHSLSFPPLCLSLILPLSLFLSLSLSLPLSLSLSLSLFFCLSLSLSLHLSDKTKCMVITTRWKHKFSHPTLDLYTGNKIVKHVIYHKLLGIHIDSELNWQSHINIFSNILFQTHLSICKYRLS